jgi:hypothetical protein
MPIFSVRFRGLAFKANLEGLAKAGLEIKEKERSPDSILGETIHTVDVEADSEGEAIEAVERAIGVDSMNYSDWQASLAE